MKCPCESCISMAICRNLSYLKLFSKCILLRRYEPFYSSVRIKNLKKMKTIEKTLKPLTWYVGYSSYSKSPIIKICSDSISYLELSLFN